MKNLVNLALFAFLIIILAGCGGDKKNLDVVKGVTPVHVWDINTTALLDSLKQIPDSRKMAFIEKNLPHLTPELCQYIESRFPKVVIDSIIYSFGSGKAKGTLDATGIRHEGVFNDELVANVYLRPNNLTKSPVKVFVRCLNGTFEIEGDRRLGPASSGFIIKRDEGLCHHLDFLTSVWLAEKFDLPLYRGNKMKDKFRITPAQARNMNTDKHQVTVLVYTGDEFNLFGNQAGYIPARR